MCQFCVPKSKFQADQTFYFKYDILVLFLHNSYGTPEFPNGGKLEGTDWMESLRWDNTEPSIYLRKTNTDLSVYSRKANTNLFMHFMKAKTEFWVSNLLPALLIVLLPSLLPLLIQHNYQFVTPQYMHCNLPLK